MKLTDYLIAKYGSVSMSPANFSNNQAFEAGYEAGQRDMRQRADEVCESTMDLASGDLFSCAMMLRDEICAIKLESEQ